MRVLAGLVAGLALAIAAMFAAPGAFKRFGRSEPTVDFTATLTAVQRQAQLTVLAARFVAVVNARQERLFGLATATRSTLVPGTVRYTMDLSAMRPQDLRWNAETKVLTVKAPPIRLQGPEIDVSRLRAFNGGLTTALPGAAEDLDAATRAEMQRGLLAEARAPFMLGLARQAGDQALKMAFELPLRATLPTATVVVERRA